MKVEELCAVLCSYKSLSGKEKDAADYLLQLFEDLHYDEYYTDQYGSVTGCIRGNRPGPKVLFDSHIDVVDVPDPAKWKKDPFGITVEDGRVYGRGATDMKGALAAVITAMDEYVKENGHNFSGEIYVTGDVHEECFEGIAARLISKTVKPDYVIICEPCNCNLAYGQRGRAEVLLETFGKPAHSSVPQYGINAVTSMRKLLDEIDKLPVEHDEDLGDRILVLTDFISSPYPGASVVPEYCKVSLDARILVGDTTDILLNPIREVIHRLEKEDESFHAKVSLAYGEEKCYTGAVIEGKRFFPAWKTDKEEEWVQKIKTQMDTDGVCPDYECFHGCTNGSHYGGEAGYPIIGFGPSDGAHCHQIDEHTHIEWLLRAQKGYQSIVKALLG